MKALIVINDFGDHKRGDMILDPDEIKKVLASHRHAVTPADVSDRFVKAADAKSKG